MIGLFSLIVVVCADDDTCQARKTYFSTPEQCQEALHSDQDRANPDLMEIRRCVEQGAGE